MQKKHAKSVLLQILQEVLRVTRGTRSQLTYLLKTFCEKKSSGDEMQHNQIFQTLFSCKHLLLFFLRLCYDNFFQKFYIIICVFCLYNIRFKIFFCRLSGILECHMVAFLCLTSLKKCHELKKSRIRETSNLSTDADRRTVKILESLRELSRKKRKKEKNGAVDASTHPPLVFRAPRV